MRIHHEVRISALVLAILALVTAGFLLGPDTKVSASIFEFLEHRYETALGFMLMVGGCLQLYGSWRVLRQPRQWGLVVSGIAWASLCGSLLNSWLFYSAIFALFALFAFCIVVKDVLGKPRAKCIHT